MTGNKVYNGLKQMAMNGRNDYGNLISDVFNSWDFDPQGSKYPRLGLVTGSDTNGNYSKFSDIFLEDGDYLRLKNITLGYTLPKSVSRFVGMENGARLHERRQRMHDHRLFGRRSRGRQLRYRPRCLPRIAFLQFRCEH